MYGDEDGMIPEEAIRTNEEIMPYQEMAMSREEITHCKEKTVRNRKYTKRET